MGTRLARLYQACPGPARSTLHPCRHESTLHAPVSTAYRDLMRRMPQPVVVITASDVPTEASAQTHGVAGVCGMTASSFASLSMHPRPLVCFNIRTPSRTNDRIAETGSFVAHILGDAPEHLVWARSMAGAEGPVPELSWETSPEGVPHVRNAVGILHCRARQCLNLEDHRLWVADVVRAEPGLALSAAGMVYFDRAFRALGQSLE